MTETVDVVIVGGGCIGTSAAYHLGAAGAGSVLLLEREDLLGTGATGACAGGFRHQFGSRTNVLLSIESIPMIVRFAEEHGLPLDVWQDGYLFLVREESAWREYVTAAEMQRSLGVNTECLSPEEAGALIPGIALEGVLGATYCPEDGVADPAGLTNGYAAAARRAGAEIRTGVDVRDVLVDDGRVVGVVTGAGEISTETVVNAAGPWAGQLAAAAGVELPIEPVPRHVVVTGPFPGVPERRTLVVDAESSLYFHREGPGVLLGMGSPDERSSFDTRVDHDYLSDRLLPTAIRVLPPLEAAGVASSWVGLYEMTPDRHPIIGEAPSVTGFYLANGFSGHGFQHAPVVGKLLAELIVEGRATTMDIAPLGLDRFTRGAPIPESHVI